MNLLFITGGRYFKFNIENKYLKNFFRQRDEETKLRMKWSCERNKFSIHQPYLGFINNIEIPFYESYGKMFSKLFFL